MKKIILFLSFLAASYFSFSQGKTPISGSWRYFTMNIDSSLSIPQDTFPGRPTNSIATKGSTLYIKSSTKWLAITGSGGSGVWGFVSGSLSSQTDLVNKFGTKADTSTRKVDSIYAVTDSTFGYYINGQFRTFKARGALTNFNGRTGPIVLTSPDVVTALGYTPSNLSAVANSLQVVNAGGGTSIAAGSFLSMPVSGVFGRIYIASDSAKIYLDNGAIWVPIGGGGGGGGGYTPPGDVTKILNGAGGAITPTKSLVGLNLVDNTPDTSKPSSTPQKARMDSIALVKLNKSSNLSDVANAATSRTNLGAEASANRGVANGYAPLNSSSIVPLANLALGTPDGSKFIADDGTLKTPPPADSSTVTGYQTVAGKKKEQRGEVILSYAEMRALTAPSQGVFYNTKINNIYSQWYWNPTSTQIDDTAMCVKLTAVTTGRLLRYYETYILADWFGLAGDGTTDDSRLMQKAVDYTLSINSHSSDLKVLSKRYVINNVFIHQDRNSDGEYEYSTITIEGPNYAFDDGQGSGPTATFIGTDKQGVIMGGQKLLHSHIQNIAFVGPGLNSFTETSVMENSLYTWLSNGTVRNNPNSPNALFVIDPVHSSVASGNRYPAWTAFYTNTSNGGSSEVTFDGCSWRYANVGLMVSPNGSTQNCDNIVMRNGHNYATRCLWGSGQSQSRGNTIEYIYGEGGTQYLVNCSDFGAGGGAPPNISHCSFAGSVKYIYRFPGGQANMSITNTKFESLGSAGIHTAGVVNFTNCNIDLIRPDAESVFASTRFAEGGSITFTGGSINYLDGMGVQGLYFNNAFVSLYGTSLGTGPLINGLSLVAFVGGQNLGAQFETNVQGQKMYFGNTLIGSNAGAHYTTTSPNYVQTFIENHTILKIDSTNHNAYFKTTHIGSYQVGDWLTTTATITDTGSIYTPGEGALGWVQRIGVDTVFLYYVPYGLTTSTTYDINCTRQYRFSNRIIGSTHSGTNVIDNVIFRRANFTNGQKIIGQDIPPNTYVVSRTSTTITLSQNMTGSHTGVPFGDAAMTMKMDYNSAEVSQGPFFIGDELTHDGDSVIYKEIAFTYGQGPGGAGTPLAKFKSVKYSVVAGIPQWITSGNDISNNNTGNVTVQGLGGIPNGLNLEMTADNTGNPGASYMPITFYTAGHVNIGQFFGVASNYVPPGGITLGANDMGLWAYSGNLNFLSSTGSVKITAGGFTSSSQRALFDGTGISLTLGSDATGDMFYRGSDGYLHRIPAGLAGQTLHWGTTPVWKDTLAGGGYTIAQIRDSLGLDTTYHFRDYTSSSATTFNIDTIYVSNGATDETIQITSSIQARLSTGGSYRASKNIQYQFLSGTLDAGDALLVPVSDTYSPDGNLSGYTFTITHSGPLIFIQCTSIAGTIKGHLEYRVQRLK